MAAAWRHKRVAASQPGFLPLRTGPGPGPGPGPGSGSGSDGGASAGRRKRVNKNKKKNWNKYSDIHDVEEFLDDVRLQERAAGGLIADKPDDSLFFVDTGDKESVPEPDTVRKKGKFSKPLHIDLILQPDSHVAPPKDILAHQRPNARKERRKAQAAEKLASMGVLPRRQKLLRKPAAAASLKEKPVTTKDPERNFYDLWSSPGPETADPYYLQQTKKKLVKRPEKLNEKPSALPAVEVVAPGASYNPDFFSHQALLLEAHEVEVKKLKAEEKLQRQIAINKANVATQESTFKEQIEGLVEEEEEVMQDAERSVEDAEDEAVGPAAQQEKKTEKQRKKEKAERKKELQKAADRKMIDSRQQLFKLRSIGVELKKREQRTKTRQKQRKARQEAQKVLPRRLGRLKFQTPDLDVQLSDEIPGSLRTLKPEGSILKDRFKSLQKRNLIEPRERAKFKRKYKLKYVEKRAFKEIK